MDLQKGVGLNFHEAAIFEQPGKETGNGVTFSDFLLNFLL
ncbi:hypothetical protein SAMN04244571_04162 [Azotobacter beijerinckii]|uniref:Uncharacterized protein n=1 Tax=Azotobacter beijerinckii TaxID=170623 RepID=A0A1I1CBF2_9GAMM|nr:hypothetical protein SAMN04244571_04162 [Azotobacter beijerinckii]